MRTTGGARYRDWRLPSLHRHGVVDRALGWSRERTTLKKDVPADLNLLGVGELTSAHAYGSEMFHFENCGPHGVTECVGYASIASDNRCDTRGFRSANRDVV